LGNTVKEFLISLRSTVFSVTPVSDIQGQLYMVEVASRELC